MIWLSWFLHQQNCVSRVTRMLVIGQIRSQMGSLYNYLALMVFIQSDEHAFAHQPGCAKGPYKYGKICKNHDRSAVWQPSFLTKVVTQSHAPPSD